MVKSLIYFSSALAGGIFAVAALLFGAPWYLVIPFVPLPFVLWFATDEYSRSELGERFARVRSDRRAQAWATRNHINPLLTAGIQQVYSKWPKARHPIALVAYTQASERALYEAKSMDERLDLIDYAVFADDQMGMHRVFRACCRGDSVMNKFERVCRVMRDKGMDAEGVIRYLDVARNFDEALIAIEAGTPVEYVAQARNGS